MSRHLVSLGLLTCGLVWSQGGPPGSTVLDLAVATDAPGIVFAVTGSDFYESKNHGQTWRNRSDGLPDDSVREVAGSEAVQYAAAGSSGVYRSRDAGDWEWAGNGMEGQTILSIATSPRADGSAYAGAAAGNLYRSLDGGDNWTSIGAGFAKGAYLDIEVSPHDPSTIFASNWDGEQSLSRLYGSTDGGGQWREVLSGPAIIAGFAFSAASPDQLWVASTGYSIAQVFLTQDAGGSFAAKLELFGIQFLDVAVDAEDPAVVYVATRRRGVLRSSDGGSTWAYASVGLPRAAVQCVESTPEAVLAGLESSGVVRSENAGAEWQVGSAGMLNAEVLALAAGVGEADSVLASIGGGMLFRSNSQGRVWGESRQGLSAFQVTSLHPDPANPDTVYAGSINPFLRGDGSLFKSMDGGSTWSLLSAGVAVHDLAVHPYDQRTIYLALPTDYYGAPGLMRSEDGGRSYRAVIGDEEELEFLDVHSVDLAPNRPDELAVIGAYAFSSSAEYRVYTSRDGGRHWQASDPSRTPLTRIDIDPFDSRRMLVGGYSGVFATTDGGESFRRSNAGLPSDGVGVAVSALRFHPNERGTVFLATSGGVYRSGDGGASWALANRGLEPNLTSRLAFHPSRDSVVFAGTYGAGVYKTEDSGMNWTPTGGLAVVTSGSVVNAATLQGGGIAPGSIVTLFVQNAGPEAEVTADGIDPATGKLPFHLGGVQVYFDALPAPLFFVSAERLDVQAPFEIADRARVRVRTEYKGSSSAAASVPVRSVDPGLYEQVLNSDGSVNGEENPAPAGSAVSLFATGQGVLTPALPTGAPGPESAPFPAPELPVQVFLDDQPAVLLSAAAASGRVGMLELRVQLPSSAPIEVTARFRVGDVESPTTVKIWIH